MPQPPALDELNSALVDVMPADRVALRARLAGLRRRVQKGQPVDRGLPALAADIEAARHRRAQRAERLPRPEYPLDLPVVARREDIKAAIAAHQVVIVCGETG